MGKYDQIFKKHLQDGFLKIVTEFLSVHFDEVINDEKPTEFTTKTLRSDFVFQVKRNGRREIWHIEEQTDGDTDMPERMLKYVALLYEKYKIPVYQVVLYVGNRNRMTSAMKNNLPIGFFTFCYEIISLSEIPYHKFLSTPETLPFAILGDFGGQRLENVLEDIGEKAEKFLQKEDDMVNFVSDLIVLSERRGLDKQVSTLKSKIMSIITDYRKTYPFKQGKLEGKEEGKEEVARALLSLGKITHEEIAAVTDLPLEIIKALAQK